MQASLNQARATTLYIRCGDSYTQAPAPVVLQSAQRLLSQRFRKGALILRDPNVIRAFLMTQLANEQREVFAVILLDSRDRLIDYVEISRGTAQSADVMPGEVAKIALGRNAASVILAHNHPSGDPTPSTCDEVATRRLRAALALVDIEVRDHLIVGETVTSFVESGLL